MARQQQRPQRSGRSSGWGTVRTRTHTNVNGTKRTYHYASYPDPSYQGTGRKPTISLSTAFPTMTMARAALAEIHRTILNGTWEHPDLVRQREEQEAAQHERDAYTFGQWGEQWLREVDASSYKANTKRDYHNVYKNHIRPYWHDVPLRSITHDDTQQWYEDLVTRWGKSENVRKKAYTIWSVITRAALEAGRIDDITPFTIKGARKKLPTQKGRTLQTCTHAQANYMIEQAVPFVATAIILAYDCGMRYQEIAALTRKDLVLSGPEPRVRIVQAVGSNNGTMVIERPKSEAAIREVPIPPERLPHLRAYLQQHVPHDPDALVIQVPHARPNAIAKNDAIHRGKNRYNDVRDRAGLPKTFTFHDLRRTYATQLGQNGASLAELKRLLGHANVESVMIYQVAEKDRVRAIAARRAQANASSGMGEVIALRAQ